MQRFAAFLVLLLMVLSMRRSSAAADKTGQAASGSLISADSKCAQLGDLLHRLARLVDFYASDPDRVNADGYFGLRLSRDLLASDRVRQALWRSTVACRASVQLPALMRAIVRKQGLLLGRFERTVGAKSSYDRVTYGRICRPIVARLRPLLVDGLGWRRVRGAAPKLPQLADDKVGRVRQLVDYDESTGDACLLAALQRDGCAVAGICAYFDRPLESSFGYYLTHQLLYKLVEQLNTCPVSAIDGDAIVTIPAELTAICKKVFGEFHQIQTANWTKISRSTDDDTVTGLRDLYIEQAVLCGLIGIEDFYHRRAIDTVASWQDPDLGCYKMFGKGLAAPASLGSITGRKILRDVEMLGGCSAHSSGVAMGYYSNAIRYLLSA